MITYQEESGLLIIIISVIFAGILITMIKGFINIFVHKQDTEALVPPTLLGFLFSIITVVLIINYGSKYYNHFNDLLISNRNYHDLLKYDMAHSEEEYIEDFEHHQNIVQKRLENGEITSFERDVLDNEDWLSLEHIPLRYIFPFKAHNFIMFFSLYFTIFAGILFAIYIKPTTSAFEKNHPQKNTVLWLNILTGWTIIGWLALLMWMNPGSEQSKTISQSSPEQQNPSATDKLLQLKALRDADAITQEEYEQKKQDLLDQI